MKDQEVYAVPEKGSADNKIPTILSLIYIK